jgi:hypothetical protein
MKASTEASGGASAPAAAGAAPSGAAPKYQLPPPCSIVSCLCKIFTSDKVRARRRGSATRCPKSRSRRRAWQCAMALRTRESPAMQLSTVSTAAATQDGK